MPIPFTSDQPLALYLFSRDEKVKEKGEFSYFLVYSVFEDSITVLTETLSGSVGINDVLLQVQAEGLPFGGVGPSGYGNLHFIVNPRRSHHSTRVPHWQIRVRRFHTHTAIRRLSMAR